MDRCDNLSLSSSPLSTTQLVRMGIQPLHKISKKIFTTEKNTEKLPLVHMAEISLTQGKQLLGVD